MKINRTLLPIKAHYLFFMAAMGPILPQLPVYGKELGISSVVMGSVTCLLPIAFLLAKPAFGMLVDVHRNHRKAIFIGLIGVTTLSYALMNFIPARSQLQLFLTDYDLSTIEDACNITDLQDELLRCNSNQTIRVNCTAICSTTNYSSLYLVANKIQTNDTKNVGRSSYAMCKLNNSYSAFPSAMNCDLICYEDMETVDNGCLYKSFTFWSFVVLMAIGTIGFNVINSISDAICFDVIGDEFDYGKQRVWGTIGFGLTALAGGYAVNLFAGKTISYTPAFIVMLVFSTFDLFTCWMKLELPIIEAPENIFKDLRKLLNNRHVITFMGFAVCAGILDSLIIYFLFWYLEDLAKFTHTYDNIKLIEGLIVAAETLGGEVIFFSISGKILERFGHVHCFSMCFVTYALRLGLISIAPTPWWILPIEFCLQGPTYALTYTTVVAYANELASPGTSATMQGIAAGMDDGVGYSIGSILGGFLYSYVGGRATLQIFSVFGVICGITHLVLHKTLLTDGKSLKEEIEEAQYKSPEDAMKATYDVIS